MSDYTPQRITMVPLSRLTECQDEAAAQAKRHKEEIDTLKEQHRADLDTYTEALRLAGEKIIELKEEVAFLLKTLGEATQELRALVPRVEAAEAKLQKNRVVIAKYGGPFS